MLRKVLVVVGLLLLAAAAYMVALHRYLFLPHLIVLGLMLTAGIVWERWQYKKPLTRPASHWQATGERFVDPKTGRTLEVYFDPGTGESHYVDAGPGAAELP
jgi:hypothetical protein